MQIVRPQPDSSAKQGDPIPNGAIIRLQHMRTRKWLHSHLHPSPITGNLEVSTVILLVWENLVIILMFHFLHCVNQSCLQFIRQISMNR